MRHRFTAGYLTLILCCTGVVSPPSSYAAGASAFSDMSSHWASPAVEWAVQKGIVNGYDDGTFKPDNRVSEPEFLAMLLRAYPEARVGAAGSGEWYEPYYRFADTRGWSVLKDTDRDHFNRGQVARTIASSQKGALDLNESIRFLLDQGLSQGKTAATVDGYQAADPLTRAEAVQFVQNLKQKRFALTGAAPGDGSAGTAIGTVGTQTSTSAADSGNTASSAGSDSAGGGLSSGGGTSSSASQSRREISVKGIVIGDSADLVTQKLGSPARKDPSEYGFQWYVYNGDYLDYAQIGVQNGTVVALYSSSANWQSNAGIKDGSAKAEVTSRYGQPVASILKGNTRFMMNYGKDEYGTYELDGTYTTFFYDTFQSGKITAVQVIDKATELAMKSFYPAENAELITAYERQLFDLANASRVKLGKPALVWDDAAAGTARGHSRDMAARDFFDHTNPDGQNPFDRMEKAGISFSSGAENISAGQTSAIFAHHGWMNSEGHRKNLLSDIERLGTGVAFGGKMHIYYTQNFYTP
ncbi:CAP-associated domain-containing protein [Paenibacillus hamazuiensis]|uniref:CAP-associated domain-containing protein n=1 Tax=Paenibacillus hamazuiensis TaxID=2936508 RepID=UPI00200D5EDA|nr:CAP-associated domain-containing protein [Paenibacillus hamazuiensis]